MKAADLAALHARCFTVPAPWDSAAFQSFLDDPSVRLDTHADGFILTRHAADEVEILTLAVEPAARRRGAATSLVGSALARAAQSGATRAFLEVATNNAPARALYRKIGFETVGQRPAYYLCADGSRLDAVIMSRKVSAAPRQKAT